MNTPENVRIVSVKEVEDIAFGQRQHRRNGSIALRFVSGDYDSVEKHGVKVRGGGPENIVNSSEFKQELSTAVDLMDKAA